LQKTKSANAKKGSLATGRKI